MSSNDSPLENVPPADAVNNIAPHAARPDTPWKTEDFVVDHTVVPRRQRAMILPRAKPKPVIERNILLTKIGLFIPSPGEDERPLKIANGVAASPKTRVKCAT